MHDDQVIIPIFTFATRKREKGLISTLSDPGIPDFNGERSINPRDSIRSKIHSLPAVPSWIHTIYWSEHTSGNGGTADQQAVRTTNRIKNGFGNRVVTHIPPVLK